MVQVLTARLLASAINATTALLSTPPDRKAPNGTSATMRERTADCISATSSSSSPAGFARLRKSEERRVGEECGSRGRSRGSPSTKKEKKERRKLEINKSKE